jgi:hypothetical protein
MSPSAKSAPQIIAPHQVWEKLPNELKVHAIRRLAQLTWNWATTSAPTHSQENRDECVIHSPEDCDAPS